MVLEGVVSVVIVGAIIEAVKRTGVLDKKYLALLSAAVGVVLGIVAVYIPGNLLLEGAALGLATGLSASGVYDIASRTLTKK